ncbi:MAG: DM13 domain-containing protein [Desulfobulbaceae bacterium]|nr:DM13 domain-containing protein [Desulfobulbaceae bacterium]
MYHVFELNTTGMGRRMRRPKQHDDFDSVVIWCKKFNVEIGRAYL